MAGLGPRPANDFVVLGLPGRKGGIAPRPPASSVAVGGSGHPPRRAPLCSRRVLRLAACSAASVPRLRAVRVVAASRRCAAGLPFPPRPRAVGAARAGAQGSAALHLCGGAFLATASVCAALSAPLRGAPSVKISTLRVEGLIDFSGVGVVGVVSVVVGGHLPHELQERGGL